MIFFCGKEQLFKVWKAPFLRWNTVTIEKWCSAKGSLSEALVGRMEMNTFSGISQYEWNKSASPKLDNWSIDQIFGYLYLVIKILSLQTYLILSVWWNWILYKDIWIFDCIIVIIFIILKKVILTENVLWNRSQTLDRVGNGKTIKDC